jgi:hypothetical protein
MPCVPRAGLLQYNLVELPKILRREGEGIAKTLFSKEERRLSNFGHLTALSSLASKYLGRYRTRRVEDAPRLPVTESCRRMSSFCSTQIDGQAVLSGNESPPTAVEKTAVVRTKRIARRPLALTVSTVCLCGMIGRGRVAKIKFRRLVFTIFENNLICSFFLDTNFHFSVSK